MELIIFRHKLVRPPTSFSSSEDVTRDFSITTGIGLLPIYQSDMALTTYNVSVRVVRPGRG